MKVAVLALTPGGLVTARRICRLFDRSFLFCRPRLGLKGNSVAEGKNTDSATVERSAAPKVPQAQSITRRAYYAGDLGAFTAGIFHCFDAIIFVMATGIAVRMIAPCLQHKTTDPAVVVVDDTGRFAVSLIGGHQGGANDLAEQIAAGIGAASVVTTATDCRGVLAFDLLARRRNWVLEHGEDMKKISAVQLAGAELCLYSDLSFSRKGGMDLPAGCRRVTGMTELPPDCHGLVLLSNCRDLPVAPPGLPYVILRPRTIVAGVGCRRGIPANSLIAAIKEALHHAGRVPQGLLSLATIDLKGDEQGLREAACHFKIPLQVFSREQVQCVEHLFTVSPFVRQHAGVGAVAEPCAWLGSSGGPLILGKRVGSGITVALAENADVGCRSAGEPEM